MAQGKPSGRGLRPRSPQLGQSNDETEAQRYRRQRRQLSQQCVVHLLQADVNHAPAQQGDEILDRVQGDDLPFVYDGRPVAQQLHVFHVVVADVESGLGQFFDIFQKGLSLLARGRFIF